MWGALVSKSDLEALFLWHARIAGLPQPETEYRFCDRKFRFDAAWPDERAAVEIDGGQWAPGGGRHAKDADREKHNLAVLHGWRVLRFSGEMLEADPLTCIEQVRRLLCGSTA